MSVFDPCLKWLKQNDTRLKNERIAPISDAAKHAWSLPRQESNVDLGDLRLEGQAPRRTVATSATMDGEGVGNALPVTSQGELHALTLALFLPRATLDDSPFRFVDPRRPVQVMDPAKVDGLAALLSEIRRPGAVVRSARSTRRSCSSARSAGAQRSPDRRGLN